MRGARGTDWRDADLLVLDFDATSAEPRRARPLSVGWGGGGGGLGRWWEGVAGGGGEGGRRGDVRRRRAGHRPAGAGSASGEAQAGTVALRLLVEAERGHGRRRVQWP